MATLPLSLESEGNMDMTSISGLGELNPSLKK